MKVFLRTLYIFAMALLFFPIMSLAYTELAKPLFENIESGGIGQNTYGRVVFFVIFLIWGLYHMQSLDEDFLGKGLFGGIWAYFSRLFQATIPGMGVDGKDIKSHMTYGLFMGLITGYAALYVNSLGDVTIKPGRPIALLASYPYIVLHSLTVAPFFEEIFFRGIIVGLACRLFDDEKTVLTLALAQALIFAFVHPINPLQKLIPALAFTAAYLWNPSKNIKTCIAMHAGVNLMAMMLI